MPYTTIDAVNATGMDDILIYVANEVPIFTPFLLLCIFAVITISVYFGTRRFQGQADFFSASAAAGFFTSVVGVLLSFAFGTINPYALIVSIGIAIFSFIMLSIKRSRD